MPDPDLDQRLDALEDAITKIAMHRASRVSTAMPDGIKLPESVSSDPDDQPE